MNESRAAEAARWLAEAWETGNPLAALPPELAPASVAEGEAIAGEVVAALGLAVIGLRYAPGPGGIWIAGPVLEPRLLRAGTQVPLAAYRHAQLSAGVLGVLAEPLGEGAPVFSALHPVLDLASQRWTVPSLDAASVAADLADLGVMLIGKRSEGVRLPETSDARLGPTGTRPRPERTPLAELMARAAEAGRRWGGLPAGAVIAVVGLGARQVPRPGERWSAAIPPIGRISGVFG
jgi:hypothetical protein